MLATRPRFSPRMAGMGRQSGVPSVPGPHITIFPRRAQGTNSYAAPPL